VTLLEHDTRQHLRQLVSQARRNRAIELDQDDGIQHCSGCQTPTFTYSAGCQTCNDRRRKLKKAANLRQNNADLCSKTGRCVGCGTYYNRYTIGCRSCITRRAKRRAKTAGQDTA
jgi:hypothetical protein